MSKVYQLIPKLQDRPLGGWAASVALWLLPTFVSGPLASRLGRQTRTSHEQGGSAARSSHPTAYLDGLRGFAALIVCIYHYNMYWFPALLKGYGSTPDDYFFWQLPFVRLLHSGTASVSLFFVISGYVLSIKTLSNVYRGQDDKILDSLASSLLRRPFRLFVPVLATTGIVALLYQLAPGFIADTSRGPFKSEVGKAFPTATEQFFDWWAASMAMLDHFQHAGDRVAGQRVNWYNSNLWTIPAEFKGSLAVFGLLLVFSRARRWARITAILAVAYWQASLEITDMDQAAFCAGMLLAELSLACPTSGQETTSSSGGFLRPRPARHVAAAVSLVLGAHFLSFPTSLCATSWTFGLLSRIAPALYAREEWRNQMFWNTIGAVLFILALMYSPLLPPRSSPRSSPASTPPPPKAAGLLHPDGFFDQKDAQAYAPSAERVPLFQFIFRTRLAQYLGDVSFAMYLCHNFVLRSVAVRFFNPAWDRWDASMAHAEELHSGGSAREAAACRSAAKLRFFVDFLVSTAVTAFAVLWASDVLWRAVDAPSVRASRYISTRVLRAR
jgi:peptidoglycan/LPS O-acetylase OafA/YrhL